MTDRQPPEANAPHLRAVRTFLPERPSGVPLVTVHGRSRRAGDQFRAFLPSAMAEDRVLIAPLFTSENYPAFQRLEGRDGPWLAADALGGTLDRLAEQHSLDTSTVDMVGYSGGAQFAHRFAMRHPERVRRLVVVSAGWFTMLDNTRPFPNGTADPQTKAPLFNLDAFLALPILVMVGEQDTKRDAGLRTSARLDRQQGENRLQRALRWVDHVEEVGRQRGISTSISFDVLPKCSHSFREAVGAGYAERCVGYLTHSTQPVTHVPDVVELPTDNVERDV